MSVTAWSKVASKEDVSQRVLGNLLGKPYK